MRDYENMSDFDINSSIAEAMGSKKLDSHCNAELLPSLKNVVVTDFGCKDYCNNPSDIMPLVVEARIDLSFGKATVLNMASKGDIYYRTRNIYRAAAVAWLKIKDTENEAAT